MNFTNPNEFWRHNGYDPYKEMSDEERMKVGCFQGVAFFVMIMLGLALCALFGSCTTTQYVPVPEYHTDTVRISHNTHDSIYVHDSTYIKEMGDTVRIERWHTKYIEKQVHDTIYQSRTDSVPKPYPFVKVVERELTTNQKGLMTLGALALMVFVMWVVFKLKRFLI
jgi:hypothetical protein